MTYEKTDFEKQLQPNTNKMTWLSEFFDMPKF